MSRTFNKEFYIQLTTCNENKAKREKALDNAKKTFANIKSPEDKASDFITKSENLILESYIKEKREEFKKLLLDTIQAYPQVGPCSADIFRIKIEIEPIDPVKEKKD
jgi:hypothetical protein